jgi:ATP-dependent DNA ligase
MERFHLRAVCQVRPSHEQAAKADMAARFMSTRPTLASILAKARPGIRFNEHIEGDGPTVFAHACKLGLEGIVSKRKDSAYRSGRSPDWLKMKNPDASAVKREEEEEWGKRGRR